MAEVLRSVGEKTLRRERQSGSRILIIVNSTGWEINVKLRTRSVNSDGGGDIAGIKTVIKRYTTISRLSK